MGKKKMRISKGKKELIRFHSLFLQSFQMFIYTNLFHHFCYQNCVRKKKKKKWFATFCKMWRNTITTYIFDTIQIQSNGGKKKWKSYEVLQTLVFFVKFLEIIPRNIFNIFYAFFVSFLDLIIALKKCFQLFYFDAYQNNRFVHRSSPFVYFICLNHPLYLFIFILLTFFWLFILDVSIFSFFFFFKIKFGLLLSLLNTTNKCKSLLEKKQQ